MTRNIERIGALSKAAVSTSYRCEPFVWSTLLAVVVALTVGLTHGGGPMPSTEEDVAKARGLGLARLAEIDRDNVHELALVWSRELGPGEGTRSSVAASDGTLYLLYGSELLALDGASGAVRWSVDVRAEHRVTIEQEQGAIGAPLIVGDELVVAYGTEVIAFDRFDGTELWSVDVAHEDRFAEHVFAHPTNAGAHLVIGIGNAYRGPTPGRVVAVDPVARRVAWATSVIPEDPSSPGYDQWEPMAPRWANGVGGGAVMNRGAYDEASATYVVGTGTPTPWDRLDERRGNAGEASPDPYTSSFIAIDAASGELQWHLPVVPGDEWEYHQDTVPVVADVIIDERTVRAALLATTTGYLAVVDVRDGTLITAHSLFPESNVHLGYDDAGRPRIDDRLRGLGRRTAERVCPGPRWAGTAPGAYGPTLGLLYRPNDVVCMRRGNRPPVESEANGVESVDWLGTEPRRPDDYFSRWGALTAVDPTSGTVRWEFATPYPHDAGALATAGGLVFSGFADRTLRAFDAATGEVLWSNVLSAHIDATPVTYAARGRQWVLAVAGRPRGVSAIPSSGEPDSVSGPLVLFAFALPTGEGER